MLEVALTAPAGRALIRLITPVVVDIDLVSRLDDIILEVSESVGATDKVISRFRRTMARHKNQATCK